MQKRPKTVLTRLLLQLVDENARYETALKTLEGLCHDMQAKNLGALGLNQVELVLRSAGIHEKKELDIPSFMKEYSAEYENEDGERSAHCCRC